jgi:hypothetical protein
MKYHYLVEGTAAATGQTWAASGIVATEQAGDFALVPTHALREAFEQLTSGKAIFGFPGVSCIGPYAITRLLVEKVETA